MSINQSKKERTPVCVGWRYARTAKKDQRRCRVARVLFYRVICFRYIYIGSPLAAPEISVRNGVKPLEVFTLAARECRVAEHGARCSDA